MKLAALAGLAAALTISAAAQAQISGDVVKIGVMNEIVTADHQNKPDIGGAIARQWYDNDGVDVIVDVPTSSVALAVQDLARSKQKAFLISGAAASDLTGKACGPTSIHWTYDT